MYIWKTKFTSYKQYFFVFLFSRKKKTDTDQSILQAFYSASKEASHKPLKVAAANKSFPSMFIIDITCFDECISFHVITGNSIFCTSLLLPRGLVQPPNCWVLWSKCFEIFFHFMSVISTHNTMMLVAKVSK